MLEHTPEDQLKRLRKEIQRNKEVTEGMRELIQDAETRNEETLARLQKNDRLRAEAVRHAKLLERYIELQRSRSGRSEG